MTDPLKYARWRETYHEAFRRYCSAHSCCVLDFECSTQAAAPCKAIFVLLEALRQNHFDYEKFDAFDLTPAMLSRFQREVEALGITRVQQRHIAPAAERCGIGHIGWHTFRHTFRSLLDEIGAPLKVQKELTRHADIRPTMSIYGKTM